MNTLYRPELLYSDGKFLSGAELLVSDSGAIMEAPERFDAVSTRIVDMPGKALLPGFVNAHSHSFQRLIRGKAESRAASGNDFWSWRGTMYQAASRLDPQDVYDVARMAFLEMVLAGTTTVGEFHYLHNAPDGKPYDDPNLLGKQVIAAARSVRLRIVLLRAAYLRSGFGLHPTDGDLSAGIPMARDAAQARFFESASTFLENVSGLMQAYPDAPEVRFGIAPHSVRAVPLPDLKAITEWNRDANLPLHMHVSEQVAENAACLREHGLTPVALLEKERILSPQFTAVHAIHVSDAEIVALAEAQSAICACPTTERNLGDGVFPADRAMAAGLRVALGSDSQAQIDSLEDARQLEYHLRLQQQKRGVLDQIAGKPLAARLFECATANGASVLGIGSGELKPGNAADFFTVDLSNIAIAGHSAEDLLSILVFSLPGSAVCDVVVNGRMIVRDRRHGLRDEIVARYNEVHRKVWRKSDEERN
ncbi:MAG: formimidoylglutamate deiminase [Acidobacteriaceae bacterium]